MAKKSTAGSRYLHRERNTNHSDVSDAAFFGYTRRDGYSKYNAQSSNHCHQSPRFQYEYTRQMIGRDRPQY